MFDYVVPTVIVVAIGLSLFLAGRDYTKYEACSARKCHAGIVVYAGGKCFCAEEPEK